jgi:hypothetical protein
VPEFISEDDLKTFDGWLRYQGIDAATTTPNELAMWRDMFDKARARSMATPKVGLMKLRRIPGEHRYAVAVREGSDLWLTLWVRRSRKGEFFVMVPRADRGWDPHTSYHLDGTVHLKSFGHKSPAAPSNCSPPAATAAPRRFSRRPIRQRLLITRPTLSLPRRPPPQAARNRAA